MFVFVSATDLPERILPLEDKVNYVFNGNENVNVIYNERSSNWKNGLSLDLLSKEIEKSINKYSHCLDASVSMSLATISNSPNKSLIGNRRYATTDNLNTNFQNNSTTNELNSFIANEAMNEQICKNEMIFTPDWNHKQMLSNENQPKLLHQRTEGNGNNNVVNQIKVSQGNRNLAINHLSQSIQCNYIVYICLIVAILCDRSLCVLSKMLNSVRGKVYNLLQARFHCSNTYYMHLISVSIPVTIFFVGFYLILSIFCFIVNCLRRPIPRVLAHKTNFNYFTESML